MTSEILEYNNRQSIEDQKICEILMKLIAKNLKCTEAKIWHAHPVWFIDGNPIVGYHKLKDCIRLLFWSGQSFDEDNLQNEGKFKAAEKRYTDSIQIIESDILRWLSKSELIQWDYKEIVKRKGVLLKKTEF